MTFTDSIKIGKDLFSLSNTMTLKTMGYIVSEDTCVDGEEADLTLGCVIGSDGGGVINIVTESYVEYTTYQIDLADLEELIRRAKVNKKAESN